MWPRHTHISQVWHLGLNAQQLIYTRYMISIWREYLYRYVFDALTFSFAHVHISTYLDTCKFYKCVYCIYVYVQIFSHTYIYASIIIPRNKSCIHIYVSPHLRLYFLHILQHTYWHMCTWYTTSLLHLVYPFAYFIECMHFYRFTRCRCENIHVYMIIHVHCFNENQGCLYRIYLLILAIFTIHTCMHAYSYGCLPIINAYN